MKGSDGLLVAGLKQSLVSGLTGQGMSELFSDLGLAQCRLVSGGSCIWLRFLSPTVCIAPYVYCSQEWDNRVMQDSADQQ